MSHTLCSFIPSMFQALAILGNISGVDIGICFSQFHGCSWLLYFFERKKEPSGSRSDALLQKIGYHQNITDLEQISESADKMFCGIQ